MAGSAISIIQVSKTKRVDRTMTEVEDAQASVEVASREVLEGWKKWKAEQATALATFLSEEARLTAINQADHTAKIAADIPVLRAKLDEAAADAVRHFNAWAEAKDNEQILGLLDLPGEWSSEAYQAVEAWVTLLLEAGYGSGLPHGKQTDYRSSTGLPHTRWGFYVPSTGTARNGRIPMASAFAFTQALEDRGSAHRHLRAAREAAQKRAAEDIWGA